MYRPLPRSDPNSIGTSERESSVEEDPQYVRNFLLVRNDLKIFSELSPGDQDRPGSKHSDRGRREPKRYLGGPRVDFNESR